MRPDSAGIPALSGLLPWKFIISTILACAFANGQAADDADYLQFINKEAQKVERRQLKEQADNNNPNSAATQLPLSAPAIKRKGIDWQTFEELLANDYRGTYTFYSELTQRSKEEIYESFINGIDMDSLREKVVTRYHHEHSKK